MTLDYTGVYCPACGSAITRQIAVSEKRAYYTCDMCYRRWYRAILGA